jgi:hypothetical protein
MPWHGLLVHAYLEEPDEDGRENSAYQTLQNSATTPGFHAVAHSTAVVAGFTMLLCACLNPVDKGGEEQ